MELEVGVQSVVSTNATGHEKQFAYDGADRLIEEVDPLSNETRYEYDPMNSLIEIGYHTV